MGYLFSLALALALDVAANPVPAPIPTPPPLALPVSKYPPNCTTTLTSLIRGFTGDFTPEVDWTVYTSTETVFSHVPCNGCTLTITTELSPIFGGIGPEEQITGTTSAVFTLTSTVCSPEYAIADPTGVTVGKAIPKARRDDSSPAPTPTAGDDALAPNCTYTQLVGITPTWGPVRTIWTTTEVITSHVNCSGCAHVSTKVLDFLNPGPVVIFNSTTTVATPSTTTTYACKRTPDHSHAASSSVPTATLA